MKYRYNETLPADFAALAQKCGARIPLKSAHEAIRNSLFTVGIFEEEQLVAFGRICGDGVLYYLVCDIWWRKSSGNGTWRRTSFGNWATTCGSIGGERAG